MGFHRTANEILTQHWNKVHNNKNRSCKLLFMLLFSCLFSCLLCEFGVPYNEFSSELI